MRDEVLADGGFVCFGGCIIFNKLQLVLVMNNSFYVDIWSYVC